MENNPKIEMSPEELAENKRKIAELNLKNGNKFAKWV